VARDVLIVFGGAMLSAGAGLLVGRLWVTRRRRGIVQPEADRRPDLADALELEAAAAARASDDVEIDLQSRTPESGR
jgi:hypothetical protein